MISDRNIAGIWIYHYYHLVRGPRVAITICMTIHFVRTNDSILRVDDNRNEIAADARNYFIISSFNPNSILRSLSSFGLADATVQYIRTECGVVANLFHKLIAKRQPSTDWVGTVVGEMRIEMGSTAIAACRHEYDLEHQD